MRGVLDRRWLTNRGPLVLELEEKLAALHEVEHCILISNATVALELAARALGLKGEVIVPSMTFIATAHAFEWLGIRPVFADIDPATHTLDPEHVETLITSRTSAIVGVHLWGTPCDVRALEALAVRHGLALVFDAAHAFGCTYGAHPIGGNGRAEILSFHATKVFNTFEGGALTTNDHELAQRVRLMQNFGFSSYDDVTSVGINGKMSEASAAMGLTQLDTLDDVISVNRRNHECYREVLEEVNGIRMYLPQAEERTNYQYVVVEIDAGDAGVSRDELMKVLWAENVLARRYFYPGCHRMRPYDTRAQASSHLPVTERVVERVLQLPTGLAVSASDIARIGEIVRTAVRRAPAVRTAIMGGGPAGE